ncbi:Sjoegren syndrome nuclear autoantigen 1 isoform X1 [Octodon degus]|uniref:Sjoegren syndrome nuclear autoantigen 1 isoform X1 n=1 Tax=Octodon degus TaxID=10160 RepID=A0A6P6D7M5_OCTDE|nr:Sjoegren syndrome nuclear autoantigen 1 isoform X1 [Octodon degus]
MTYDAPARRRLAWPSEAPTMTLQGAALQNYNNELVMYIEELCQKRGELYQQIQQEEEEKERLQGEVRQLTEKLTCVDESLQLKIASLNDLDRTIAETEAAYLKVGLPASACAPRRRVGLERRDLGRRGRPSAALRAQGPHRV